MRRLEAKGTTIAYARTGAGPPIVPMHGADADHSIVARLSAQPDNHRTVIVYGRRDSGDTGKPGQPSMLTPVLADREDRLVPCGHPLPICRRNPGLRLQSCKASATSIRCRSQRTGVHVNFRFLGVA